MKSPLAILAIIMPLGIAHASPCDGITSDTVRDIEQRFPRTMSGVPAMPVAVSKLYVTDNGDCAADMIVTFNGKIGYSYTFLVERRPDRIHLEPIFSSGLRNPAPIQLYYQ